MVEAAFEHSIAFSGMDEICDRGIFKNGATKPFEEKVEMIRADPHSKPSIRVLAKAAKVSRRLAGKIVSKLGKGLLGSNIPQGKGSISILDEDGLVLVRMQGENNQCTLHAYRQGPDEKHLKGQELFN
jgi:hypothetical protein